MTEVKKHSPPHFHIPPDGKKIIWLSDSGKTMKDLEYSRKNAGTAQKYLDSNPLHADWMPEWGLPPADKVQQPLPDKAKQAELPISNDTGKSSEPKVKVESLDLGELDVALRMGIITREEFASIIGSSRTSIRKRFGLQ